VGNVLSTALCLALATSALARAERHLLYEGAVTGLARGSLGDLVDGYQRAFTLLLAASLIATLLSFSNSRGRVPARADVPVDTALNETGTVPK